MFDLARRAMDQAHAPYSKFPVGAVVRGGNGRLYAGCNVENAAYPKKGDIHHYFHRVRT